MHTIRCIVCCFLITAVGITQFSGSLSHSYGKSNNNFNFQESFIDINGNWNQWAGWIQFEISNPPELGRKFTGLRKFRIEYTKGPLSLQMGDIYTFWGRGLMVNMVEDQAVDLDTGIRGGLVNWTNNFLDLALLSGSQKIWRLTNQVIDYDNRIPNYGVENFLYGSRISGHYKGWNGGVQVLKVEEDHPDAKGIIEKVDHLLMGATLDYFGENGDVGLEWVKKDSIGFGLFGNVNMYLWGWSLGGSYKNYHFANLGPDHRWDFVNYAGGVLTIQQMPTVFKEHSTRLLSRITHIIDYNDEVGFDIHLEGPINPQSQLTLVYAQSSRHNEWVWNNKSIKWEMISSSVNMPSSKNELNPFKEFYAELDGNLMNGNFHYTVGIGTTEDVIDLYLNRYTGSDQILIYEAVSAQTFPTHFSYTLNTHYSLEVKYEYQELKKGIHQYAPSSIVPFESNFMKETQYNRFMSIGVSRSPKWSANLAIDMSSTDEQIIVENDRDVNSIEKILGKFWDTSLTWASMELAYNISENHRLTIMVGSQRGGVLCSNGVCRYIQPFENGFKVGLVSLF